MVRASARSIICLALPEVTERPWQQADLVAQEPERFFVPPYVGHNGWIGVRLDTDVDWD
jgi:hypothetical protein